MDCPLFIQVKAVLTELKTNKKIATATHNILTYRRVTECMVLSVILATSYVCLFCMDGQQVIRLHNWMSGYAIGQQLGIHVECVLLNT